MKKPIHHSMTPTLLRLLVLVLVLALAPLPLLANDAVMAKPSVAPGLPQDLFQTLGAPAGTLLDKGNQVFDIRAYGASTALADNASKINDTITAAGANPVIFIPAGTWKTSKITLPSNCTIIGAGKGRTVLKRPDGATGTDSSTVFTVPSASSNVTLRDLTLDGNRANQGAYTNLGSNACLFVGGSNILVDNLEIAYSCFSGVFIGDNATAPANITFSKCWIHDNGGVLDSSGNGAGLIAGGSPLAERITVQNCRIESNYNTVTRPNDSNGINFTVGPGVIVIGNTFRDNFNVGGGQITIGSGTSGGTGTGYIDTIVDGNFFYKTTSFGSPADSTNGIEIEGRGFSIANNVIDGFTDTGINVESSGGRGTITGNTMRNGPIGIRLFGTDTDTVGNVLVSGNMCLTSTYGIHLTPTNDKISIIGNDLSTPPTAINVFGSTLLAMTNNVSFIGNLLPGTTGVGSYVSGAFYVDGLLSVNGTINGLTRTASDLAVKPPCGLVATSNLTLSGAQTVDGVAGTAGQTIVLCTAQTTASQNGPWVMQSGAWTRPDWYATGNTNQAFQFITSFIRLGALYSGTTWYCTTSGTITIGTTSTAWIASITPPVISDTAYASSWNGATTLAPSKNALYDWAHTFDTDDDGKVNVLDVGAGITKTDSSGVVSVATAGTDYVAPSSLGIRARAYNSANISIANNSLVALTFNSETDDTDTMHSTSSNTGRMTATTAGYYTFCASLEFASNATGSRRISFRKNGSTRFGDVSLAADANGGATTNISTCSDYSMSAGDYVEVTVFQNSGGSLNVNRTSDWTPIFSAKRNP